MILCKELTITTHQGAVLLGALTFELPAGANLFVVGESGSGKSSLLEALAGLSIHQVSGWVGQPPPIADELRAGVDDRRDRAGRSQRSAERRSNERRAAVLPDSLLAVQEGRSAFSPYRRLDHQMQDVPALAGARSELLGPLLEEMGLDPTTILKCYPHQCSGGMLRRVCLAAILAARPRIALFDEPTNGVDPSLRWQVADVIRRRAAQFIMATHDMAIVGRAPGDYLLVLRHGKNVEFGPANDIIEHPRTSYVGRLLQAGRRI
jgi:ABC-type glutathione transport system ATPase component